MPGNPLSITLPTVGVTVGPDYATSVNLALQTIIDDVEAKVTPDEIEMNDDLDFKPGATAYGLTGVDRVELDEHSSAITAGTGVVFHYNDELYFRDGTGTNIAITSSGTVAAAAGNISTTGSPAYSALAAGLQWSGGDLEYRFLDDGTNGHAGIVFLDAQFRNGANSMTMESNVTTDYTVTWPTDAPGSTLLQQVSSSGAVSWSNTVVNAATFSGLITASVGLTAAANQDVAVSGTGAYKHGEFQESYAGITGQLADSSDNVYMNIGNFNHSQIANAAGTSLWKLWVAKKVGKTIESVDLYWDPLGTVGTKTFLCRSASVATGTASTEGNASLSTSASGIVTTNLVTSAFTLTASEGVEVVASIPQGVEIIGVDINYSE